MKLGRARRVRFFCGLCCLLTCSVLSAEPRGGHSGAGSPVLIIRPQQPPIRRTVQSWTARRQQHVVIQSKDYSCGAAALATLFQHYFEDPVSEEKILQVILGTMDEEEVADRQANGLSMSDLLDAAEELGYLGAVIRLPPQKIPALPAPVIVRIERGEFKHFVVLRGSVGDRIFVADPIRGNMPLPAWRFLNEWSGEALVLGKADFGLPDDHPLSVKRETGERIELAPVRRWLIRAQPPQAR